MVDIHYFGYGDGESSWTERIRLLAAPYAIVDGMNEYGVAVSEMAVPLDPARCEGSTGDSQRVAILNNHIMRLVLDHARNVDEALALIADYRLRFPVVCTHHLIADAGGSSAIVEYSDGEMIVTRNTDPWLVATNFVVSETVAAEDPKFCWRYATATEALSQAQGALTQQEGMALLKRVAQPDTVWSVVYNLVTGDIHLAMGRQYDRVHTFTLSMPER
jgi:penicillin V acylase-like amidase (Ntn superfamily)